MHGTFSDASTDARKAPTWRLHAKARPGSRSVTCRENFASVLESSSVNQSRWTAMSHRSLRTTHQARLDANLQQRRYAYLDAHALAVASNTMVLTTAGQQLPSRGLRRIGDAQMREQSEKTVRPAAYPPHNAHKPSCTRLM